MNIKKIISTLLILISIDSNIHAYVWSFSNFTKKTFLVQIELLHSSNPYFVLIPSRQSGDFSWPAGNTMGGFCMGKIKYLIPSESFLNMPRFFTKTMVNGVPQYEVKDTKAIVDLCEHNEDLVKEGKAARTEYLRKTVDLRFMPDKLFNETVEQAKKAMGTDVGAKIVGWFADIVKESACRSRDIKIVEKSGEIGFYTLAK